jgi:hypothetical protein
MFGYVSTVPGIGVDTDLFVVWTKRMPGTGRFDPPGSYCQWQESIECSSHPFGFDWKTYRDEQRKIRNVKDTSDNAKLERPPRFQKLHHVEVNRKTIGTVEASSIESQQVIEDREFGSFVNQVNTLGRHRRGSSLMNGLTEDEGYSKFSHHRCRIAW